jgi:hypothetical protein
MKHFENGQRVIVRAIGDDDTEIPPTLGTVRRKRISDNGAWIELDTLADELRSFPVGDSRANHALAYPENCDPTVTP